MKNPLFFNEFDDFLVILSTERNHVGERDEGVSTKVLYKNYKKYHNSTLKRGPLVLKWAIERNIFVKKFEKIC